MLARMIRTYILIDAGFFTLLGWMCIRDGFWLAAGLAFIRALVILFLYYVV